MFESKRCSMRFVLECALIQATGMLHLELVNLNLMTSNH